jgi:O-antigen ligase
MAAFIISLGLYFIVQPNTQKVTKYLFFAFLLGITVTTFTVPSLKIRMNEIIDSSFKPPKGYGFNSINVRAGVWQCSFSLIKDNWAKGIGAGRVQDELNNCYKNYDTNAFSSVDYNTHNEYFNILLGTGIIGLLAFLYMIIIVLYHAYKIRNPLFFSFVLLCALCFLTENILDRQGGIVFFVFFISVFTRVYVLQAAKPEDLETDHNNTPTH